MKTKEKKAEQLSFLDNFKNIKKTEKAKPAGASDEKKGACQRCGRTLTRPESIQAGYGETCYKKIHGTGFTTSTRRARKPEPIDERQGKLFDDKGGENNGNKK